MNEFTVETNNIRLAKERKRKEIKFYSPDPRSN